MGEIRQALRYCRPHWAGLIGAIAAGGGALFSQMAIPLITRALVDNVLSGRAPERLGLVVSWFVAAALGTVFFGVLQNYLFARFGGQIAIDIRNQLADHMRHIPLDDAHDKHSGEIMSMFMNDVPAFCKFFELVVGQSILSTLKLATALLIVSFVFHKLAFMTLLAIPAYILIPAILSRRVRQAAKSMQERQAALAVGLQESISGMREIRAFNGQEWDKSRLQGAFKGTFRAELYQILLRGASSSTYIVYWMIIGAIYLVGGRGVLSGQISLGSLLAAVGYFASLEDPVRTLVGLNQQLQSAMGAAHKIFQFLAVPRESLDAPGAERLNHCSGKVQFDGVSFAYQHSEAVLTDLNFTIYPGQRVALVGPSGSGKTSLICLLLRLFEPTRGRILIDDRDIRNFTVDSLRHAIRAVFQDVFLFAATVRDNIRFGDHTASDNAITESAVAAYIHEFIVQLPQAYDTIVGERGVKLSGGQKQRLAVARALVGDPRILVLDEATSALDSESELGVYRALLDRFRHRTTFIVAHRLSTILAADTILVLSEGRIIAKGTHQQLMKSCILYQKLYNLEMTEDKEWHARDGAIEGCSEAMRSGSHASGRDNGAD
jgi:ABC-type multidrug transport system fused ATPase/permease subunit